LQIHLQAKLFYQDAEKFYQLRLGFSFLIIRCEII
jgi:hypothetical protein